MTIPEQPKIVMIREGGDDAASITALALLLCIIIVAGVLIFGACVHAAHALTRFVPTLRACARTAHFERVAMVHAHGRAQFVPMLTCSMPLAL